MAVAARRIVYNPQSAVAESCGAHSTPLARVGRPPGPEQTGALGTEKLISRGGFQMAGKNGGARPGAGRKPRAELHARPIKVAEKRIADRLPLLIDNLFTLADGVTIQEEDEDGNPRIYSRPPDRHANEYLVNRILGKPTERSESDVSLSGGVVIHLPKPEIEP
jgi:hypothetical protein